MTIPLGIVGSFVGGLLGFLIFHEDGEDGFFQPSGIVGSVIGAIIVLLLWVEFGPERRSVTGAADRSYDTDHHGCVVTAWVVAVEHAGADLEPLHPAPRRPVLEHAYDLGTGRFAHGGDGQLRVGFTRPTPGWPASAT